jgi:hypothetical protein
VTYTYAILEVSPQAYRQIREKLEAAGHQHAFHGDLIDMHGIAIKAIVPKATPALDPHVEANADAELEQQP